MRTDTPPAVKLEAYKPYPFEIDRVRLDIRLDPASTRIVTDMQVQRRADGDMVLDGVGLTLRRLELDGRTLAPGDYILGDETLTLQNVPDQFRLVTEVEIAPRENTALSGLYMSGGRFCTQCEADGFRRITYWPDRPDVMSRFDVRLEAEKARYPILLSNGTPGAAGDLPGGWHFAEWTDPHPKPSYLFALCAGDYDVHTDTFTTASGRRVELAIHVDKGEADRAVYAMDSLKRAMRWDELRFGREYDLGRFNIVAVRDFNFGAMENKGLNIFNSAYVLADEATATDADFEAIESIVAHEYFHNWTGNRITCRDWFQLCLKEGLTVFRDQEFSAEMRSAPVQRVKDVIRLRSRQFPEDAGPLAHPVRPDSYASVDNLYTATVYEKGAELIRMLRVLIGEAAFTRGMDLYFERHDGTAATIEDFYACFEAASGEDLGAFRRWYAQPGTPHVTVTREAWDREAGRLSVTLTQETRQVPGQPSPQPVPIPLRAALLDGQGGHVEAPEWPGGERTLVLSDAELTVDIDLGPGADRPLLSLNRGFSAPIRLSRDLGFDDRIALVAAETDAFNRWDGLQHLISDHLLAMAYDQAEGPDLRLVEAQADAVRRSAHTEPAVAALMARVPDVGDLFQERDAADASALDAARGRYRAALATQLAELGASVLAGPSPSPFRPDADQAGQRALRAAMIDLAATGAQDEAAARLKALYDRAPNMTEQLATLRALARTETGPGSEALADFERRWTAQPLIMDKWFAVQAATARRIGQVEALLAHPGFETSNPNRVRAVAAVFAMQNLPLFHAPDGSGYALLSRIVRDIDPRNPALAARLLTAFEQWRRLEPQARARARDVLEALSQAKLSKNAQDILGRCLGEG